MSLDGKVVIVTGASGNLGSATARVLAQSGVRIVAAERQEDAARGLVDSLPDPARHLPLGGIDLTAEADCVGVAAQAMERYGRIDGLAATVGGYAGGSIEETNEAMLTRMFRINTLTALNMMRAVLPGMRPAGTGSIVVVGAASAVYGAAGIAAYTASKSAVFRLVESFAEELRPAGIRVNAVLPGTLDTPQNRAAMPGADSSTWVQPAQLADVIAFLLSDQAMAVTGALLPVTGCAGRRSAA